MKYFLNISVLTFSLLMPIHAHCLESFLFFREWGQSVQSIIRDQDSTSYMNGKARSLFSHTDACLLVMKRRIWNADGTITYFFHDDGLRECCVHITKPEDINALYADILDLFTEKYSRYAGNIFPEIEHRFTNLENNTLILILKDTDIYLYLIDLNMQKRPYS